MVRDGKGGEGMVREGRQGMVEGLGGMVRRSMVREGIVR